MRGDDRVRFCSFCSNHVYNLSMMTREETADLLRIANGELCARLYQRPDQPLVTEDCRNTAKPGRCSLQYHIGSFMAVIAVIAAALGLCKTRTIESAGSSPTASYPKNLGSVLPSKAESNAAGQRYLMGATAY
jgi:hypothetical protein